MSFIVKTKTACAWCDTPIYPGQEAYFNPNGFDREEGVDVSHYPGCPEPLAICPVHFTEMSATGVCGECE